jgi:glutamine synthetase
VPDEAGEVRLDFADGTPVEHWFIGDILKLDETPWECCPRAFLKRALAELETVAGFRLKASFEHEFHLTGAHHRSGDSYAMSSLRSVGGFSRELIGALRVNGLEPETYLPEYGPRQYEITVRPALDVEAADRAVKLREICRAVAERHGLLASFAPVVTRGIVGNGVHIHFSLEDLHGNPVSYDRAAPGGLAASTAAFAAGILRHVRAVCAVTAPSLLSYERLRPHAWSAYWGNLGQRDREALLRICPLPTAADIDPAPRFNLEFRAADAAASPYLQLGMLVMAGLQGIKDGLAPPTLYDGDPEELSEEQRRSMGIQDLPRSLEEALQALEADAVARAWLGPTLADAYLMHKRGEIGMLQGLGEDEICRRYAEAY